jgi:hypothetical protein
LPSSAEADGLASGSTMTSSELLPFSDVSSAGRKGRELWLELAAFFLLVSCFTK